MGFLKDFKYDLFVSYSHIDNETNDPAKKGWVDKFYDELQLKLWQRFGGIKKLSIFWDSRKIDPSQDFERTLYTALDETAVFVSLTSNGYLRQDGYCLKELRRFFQRAQTDRWGLLVEDRRRIFNLLLYKIHFTKWPTEHSRGGEFVFYDVLDPRDDDDEGFPLEDNDPRFGQEIKKLVSAIQKTLYVLKQREVEREQERAAKQPQPPGVPLPSRPRVFLAQTSDLLRLTRMRVEEELKRSDVDVVSSVPPPFPSAEHARRVADEIGKSHLSIHLLDNLPGFPIEDEEDRKTYPQRQVELGVQHARSQIIWLPKESDMPPVEDESYRNFLGLLEQKKREDEARYEFIREQQTASVIIPTVLEKIKKLAPPEPPRGPAVMIDANQKDRQYALKIGQYFKERGDVEAYINSEEDDPGENISNFEQRVKKARALIMVFGAVDEQLVRQRVWELIKSVINAEVRLASFNIFLAPPEKNFTGQEFGYGIFSPRILNNSDTEALKTELLDELVSDLLEKGGDSEIQSLAS